MKTLRERINEKWVEAENGCWEWIGARCKDGYGTIKIDGKLKKAHRLSWELHNGKDVPEGMCICHTCDNPSCQNPAHLVCRDSVWNTQDKVNKGRQFRPKGEKHPMAKLALSDVQAIRQRISNGENQSAIGREYGIGQAQVSRIKTGRRWI